jgi:hypothetical protein
LQLFVCADVVVLQQFLEKKQNKNSFPAMQKDSVHSYDFSVITVIFYSSALLQSDKKIKNLLLPKPLKSDNQKFKRIFDF